MPMELRKRKAPEQAPAPAPAAKKAAAKKTAKPKAAPAAPAPAPAQIEEQAKTEEASSAPKTSATAKPSEGGTIDFDGFGGEVTSTDGSQVTLQDLVNNSKAGVVLFTYPKAKTGGCTQQVKLFRDSYTELASTGFSIYGLSNDSPKSNNSFKEQQKLSYELLCDPERTLINAIGLKSSGGKTQRGVFVVDKQGKVLAAEPGGPAATVEVVRRLVGEEGADKAETKAA